MAGLKRQDDFLISVRAGDRLVLATSTPGDGRGQNANTLDPLIELFDPGGRLVAHDDNGAPDGRNASLSHTATATGAYLVRVQPADTSGGEYVLQVTGQSGAAPKFQASVREEDFADTLASAPAQLTLQFSSTVLLGSLAANDLTVDGAPSKGWTAVDGRTITFDLPAGLASGTHVVSVAAGAILDIGGTPVESFKLAFTLDTTPPAVSVVPSYTFDATPPLSGTVDDPQAQIRVTVGGKTYPAVNRGDGTWTVADDVISPSLAPGVYDVQVAATDAFGRVGADARTGELTVWPPAAIRGTNFNDMDGDGVRDASEPGLAGVTMYLDIDRNGRRDSGEPSTTTWQDDPLTPDVDETGMYVFTGLEPGSYVVAEVVPAGWQQTSTPLAPQDTPVPTGGSGAAGLIRLDALRADSRFEGLRARRTPA